MGIGGSVTVRDIGLDLALEKENKVLFPMRNPECFGLDTLLLANKCPVYISSVNAMTEEGQIINIDGNGTVCPPLFTAPKGLFRNGVNKIKKDYESAFFRARNVAGPLNARRLKKKTPCTTGEVKCHDCSSPDRICNVFVTFERPLHGVEAEVVLIGETLGF